MLTVYCCVFAAPGPFEAWLHELGVLDRGGFPTDDGQRKQVDRQGHGYESGIYRDLGENGDPITVRRIGVEVAVQKVSGMLTVLARDFGSGLTTPNLPVHAFIAHEPVHRVFGGFRNALTARPGRSSS